MNNLIYAFMRWKANRQIKKAMRRSALGDLVDVPAGKVVHIPKSQTGPGIVLTRAQEQQLNYYASFTCVHQVEGAPVLTDQDGRYRVCKLCEARVRNQNL